MSSSSIFATHTHNNVNAAGSSSSAAAIDPQLFLNNPSGALSSIQAAVNAAASASANPSSASTASVGETNNATNSNSQTNIQKTLDVQIRRAMDLIDRVRGTDISEKDARALKTFLTSVDNIVKPIDQRKRDEGASENVELCERQEGGNSTGGSSDPASALEPIIEQVETFLNGILKGMGNQQKKLQQRDSNADGDSTTVKSSTINQKLASQHSPQLSQKLQKAQRKLKDLEGKKLSDKEEKALKTYISQIKKGFSDKDESLDKRNQITDLISFLIQSVENLLSSLLGGILQTRGEFSDSLNVTLTQIRETINTVLTHSTTLTAGLAGEALNNAGGSSSSGAAANQQQAASNGANPNAKRDSNDNDKLLTQAQDLTDNMIKALNQDEHNDKLSRRDENGSEAINVPKSMIALVGLVIAGLCAY